MSAEIVNLRRARRAKERLEQDLRAAANRAKFGRTGSERRREAAETARSEREHAGNKLD